MPKTSTQGFFGICVTLIMSLCRCQPGVIEVHVSAKTFLKLIFWCISSGNKKIKKNIVVSNQKKIDGYAQLDREGA